MNELILKVESIIFCSPKPLTLQEIKNCIEEDGNKEISDDKIKKFVEALIKKYDDEKFSFEIIKLANGYQFLTKSKYIDITNVVIQDASLDDAYLNLKFWSNNVKVFGVLTMQKH